MQNPLDSTVIVDSNGTIAVSLNMDDAAGSAAQERIEAIVPYADAQARDKINDLLIALSGLRKLHGTVFQPPALQVGIQLRVLRGHQLCPG